MAVIIILIFLAVLISALFLPLKLDILFFEDFTFKITYCGFKIYPRKKSKPKSNIEKGEASKENILKNLYKENKLSEFLNLLFSFLKTVFNQLGYILKHIKIRNFDLKIWVASNNAALTAIEYGVVSTAVYNILQFISTFTDIKLKKVDIFSDFENKNSRLTFFTTIKISPIFLIISAVVLLKKYMKLTNKKGSVINERK